ncbi:hypothetical protein [Fulvimonas yonginensis]|uniref:Metallothionein n=1 Tax=Fulvimonas yonginensis TaxID=1495200 RepID=A0ABU8JDT0_9GAMM
MSDNGYRCGHAPCQCTVPGGGQYCSEHCREAAASGRSEGAPCGCGHAVCRTDPQGDLRKGGE